MNNSVRNVMVNELGLTKEYVRKEAEEYIIQIVDKYMGTILESSTMEKIVHNSLNKVIATKYTSYSSAQSAIELLINRKVEELVLEYLRENLTFTIKKKDENEKEGN